MKKLYFALFIALMLVIVPVNSIKLNSPNYELNRPKFNIEYEIESSYLPRLPELRVMDDPPTVDIFSNKQTVDIAEEFELTIIARDNKGLYNLIVDTGELTEFSCGGAVSCIKKITVSENAPGVFTYKAITKDKYGWEAEDETQVSVEGEFEGDLEVVSIAFENIDPTKYSGSSVHSFLHADLVEATVVVRNNGNNNVQDVELELKNSDESIQQEQFDLDAGETKVVKFQFILDALSCEPGNVIATCHPTVDYARNYNLNAEISSDLIEDLTNNKKQADEFTALSFKHHAVVTTVPNGQRGEIKVTSPIINIVLKIETDQNIDPFKWIMLELRAFPDVIEPSINQSSTGCTDMGLCDGLGPEFNSFTCGSYTEEEISDGNNDPQDCYYPAVSGAMPNLHTWTTNPVQFPGIYVFEITLGNHPDDQITIRRGYFNI